MVNSLDGSQLADKIKHEMAHLKVPGVAVGVLHDDQTFTAGFGITNVDHPLEVTPSTLFQIGSITKTFVGTLAMQLVEEGLLDLDAPVRTYLPDFKVPDKNAADQVTMRHLFTHTAGWVGDFFPDGLGHGDDAVANYTAAMAEVPQLSPVGEVLSYNNAGFNLAGRVYEVLLGKPFSTIAKERLFDPLEMRHTYLLPWDIMTHRFVSGHLLNGDTVSVATPWSIGRASGPAGGIITCVSDMLHYARFQLGDGMFNDKRLLKAESLAALHAPHVNFAPGNTVALTFWLDDSRAVRTMGHGGGTVGQISQFILVPERKFAIIIVTNADNGGELNTTAVNFALEHYLGISTPEPAIIDMSRDQLAAYAGRYEAALTDSELTLGDDGLSVRVYIKGGFPTKDTPPRSTEPSPPVRLGFYGEDLVVGLDDPFKGAKGEFLRSPDGSIAWFRFLRRIHRPA